MQPCHSVQPLCTPVLIYHHSNSEALSQTDCKPKVLIVFGSQYLLLRFHAMLKHHEGSAYLAPCHLKCPQSTEPTPAESVASAATSMATLPNFHCKLHPWQHQHFCQESQWMSSSTSAKVPLSLSSFHSMTVNNLYLGRALRTMSTWPLQCSTESHNFS